MVEAAEEGTLSRTAGTNDHMHLPFGHGQTNPTQYLQPTKGLMHIHGAHHDRRVRVGGDCRFHLAAPPIHRAWMPLPTCARSHGNEHLVDKTEDALILPSSAIAEPTFD